MYIVEYAATLGVGAGEVVHCGVIMQHKDGPNLTSGICVGSTVVECGRTEFQCCIDDLFNANNGCRKHPNPSLEGMAEAGMTLVVY